MFKERLILVLQYALADGQAEVEMDRNWRRADRLWAMELVEGEAMRRHYD
jgi:hypothetical protein